MRKNLELLILIVGPVIPLGIGVTAMISGLLIEHDTEFIQIGLICIFLSLCYLYFIKTNADDWKKLDILEKDIIAQVFKFKAKLNPARIDRVTTIPQSPPKVISVMSSDEKLNFGAKIVSIQKETPTKGEDAFAFFQRRLKEEGISYESGKSYVDIKFPNGGKYPRLFFSIIQAKSDNTEQTQK